MTYLIIRLATLGNVAMTVPVVASLSKRYPNDLFIVASKKKLGDMFSSMPNVVFWEVDNHLDWRGTWRLWRVLRHEADVVIDLQNVLRTKVFGWFMRLSGKKVNKATPKNKKPYKAKGCALVAKTQSRPRHAMSVQECVLQYLK